MKKQNGFIAAIVVLALGLIGSLIWGAQNSQEVDALETNKLAITASLDEMTQLRDDLATEVETLMVQYNEAAEENTALSGQLAEAQDQVQKAQSAVARAKRNAAAEIKDLTAQIEALQTAKQELTMAMEVMVAQNDSLRVRTGVLETNLAVAETNNQELNDLNIQKEGEIKSLTYQTFKATSFEVSPEVKRGNATSKSARVRRITASFDLQDVPNDYQGERPIYLVITDASGTPIPRTDYIETMVKDENGQNHPILAVEKRQETLSNSQRLTFSHELENKLDAGQYTLSAYTDVGLLGSSTFRLR